MGYSGRARFTRGRPVSVKPGATAGRADQAATAGRIDQAAIAGRAEPGAAAGRVELARLEPLAVVDDMAGDVRKALRAAP
jgi:hypothetical protein